MGGPYPATISVIVKSTDFGHTVVVGTRIGTSSDYAFTFIPPDGACNTTIVAYVTKGQNTNNDLIDDGLQNGSSNAACGLRLVDDTGAEVPCTVLGVENRPWGEIKSLFR